MQNLERTRRLRGLTQKNLADKARVSEGTVAGIEAGRHAPRASTARKLAAALGVQVADLYGEAIPKAPESTRTGDERLVERLAPRVARLENLDLTELSEHRRELERKLPGLKEEIHFRGATIHSIRNDQEYQEVMDELLALITVLERKAAKQLA